jgi:hypothetical protein
MQPATATAMRSAALAAWPRATSGQRGAVATERLVRSQVQALLDAAPSFHELSPADQQCLRDRIVTVSAYAAELARDVWRQSERIGQQPVLVRREVMEPLTQAQASADEFRPAAANQVARVTRETLQAIAFPTFVADLIKGTFNAIIQSSIQQMDAYQQLLENVSKSVEQFMESNITDNAARDWLAQNYPRHIRIQTDGDSARAVPRDGADVAG